MAKVYDDPFCVYAGPRVRKMQAERERRRSRKLKAGEKWIPSHVFNDATPARRMISHFVMNLPDSAITFLDAFRGLLVGDGSRDLAGIYREMPMIHCYCFTREHEFQSAERDIRRVRMSVTSCLSCR